MKIEERHEIKVSELSQITCKKENEIGLSRGGRRYEGKKSGREWNGFGLRRQFGSGRKSVRDMNNFGRNEKKR